MPRPKISKEEERLSQPIIIRVNAATFKKLEQLAKDSNCRSIGEVARRILTTERILLLHRDASMDGPMEELAVIRKELKSIGININQQTHYFHAASNPDEKAFYVNRTAILYRDVDQRLIKLLLIVEKLAAQWLQK